MNKNISSIRTIQEILRTPAASLSVSIVDSNSNTKRVVQFENELPEEEEEKTWWRTWRVPIFILICCCILVAVAIGVGVTHAERDLYFPHCDEQQFHCPSTGLCLNLQKICDNHFDCTTKHHLPFSSFSETWEQENYGELADEIGCYPPTCSKDKFLCDDGNCVSTILDCHSTQSIIQMGCGNDSRDFPCGNKTSDGCISRHLVCNSIVDCASGLDEEGCGLPVITKSSVKYLKMGLNQSFSLRCLATGKPMPFMRWRHNLTHIPSHCNSRISASTGMSILNCQIRSISDYGSYLCQAANMFGSTFSRTFTAH